MEIKALDCDISRIDAEIELHKIGVFMRNEYS